jgi:hypothetical protein
MIQIAFLRKAGFVPVFSGRRVAVTNATISG